MPGPQEQCAWRYSHCPLSGKRDSGGEAATTPSGSPTPSLCLRRARVKQGNPGAFLANLYQVPPMWDLESHVSEVCTHLPAV